MIKKLLIGIGIFAAGYVVGKAVGRSESEFGGQLGWEGAKGGDTGSRQTGMDAEFGERAPGAEETRTAG
jgi:hypothetical protein